MLIGEVARRSGVSTRMLRHYDNLGLVRPTGRTTGGYREYADADIRRIFHVESLRTLGLSLRQIGAVLDDPGFAPAALIADLTAAAEERLARERELLKRLKAVDASDPEGWEDVLRIVELLRGLGSASAARRQQAALEAELPAALLAEAVLAEADPHVAGALQWALARADSGVVASLVPGLASPDAAVRLRAATALAEIPGDESSTALDTVLDDADTAVRARAALALGARGSAAAIPVLVDMIVKGANDVDAAEVLGALAADPGPAAAIAYDFADALASAAPAARLRLVQALAELPPGLALDLLRPLASDPDATVARTAAALAGVVAARERGEA
ncbi:HEAT repeat domain-containing protein [Glycomyces sp. MUSA5-2]|uniref:HEAT repeat domain-containing protein n=1 Tax=Glycomyces sp. MUSA5-2 TaxID=2053002 RepID=UPI00300886EC